MRGGKADAPLVVAVPERRTLQGRPAFVFKRAGNVAEIGFVGTVGGGPIEFDLVPMGCILRK